MNFHAFNRAIVRTPSRSVVEGLRAVDFGAPSYDGVVAEHRDYVRVLESLGVSVETLPALESGPVAPGSATRDEIMPGLRSLHIARRGRPGRHFILYRAADGNVVEVLRILHDAMELSRHMPKESG